MAVVPGAEDDTTPVRLARRPAPDPLPHLVSADLHPVVRRVLAARAVPASELTPVLARLVPVGTLPGIDAAVSRLVAARRAGEAIVVIGDFVADGATATALMIRCLRRFGFPRTAFLVPDRFLLGYGLSPAVVERALAGGKALLVTVDNGISSLAGVCRAAELGCDVLVTDHHLPGQELPACIVVNPNVPDSRFASPALCGVGVAFYVMAALGRALASTGEISDALARQAPLECLDLVALGTVADVVPLDFNNRILVAEGLRRIRAGRAAPGIAALFAVGRRDPAAVVAADLGFSIAPRLNAAGRLADMTVGVQCLLADDPATAAALAGQLDALNAERRELQARMEDEALLRLADDVDGEVPAVTLFDERWHLGIVGLVAGRLRERSGRPAVAFARDPASGLLRGSARSVPGVHVRDCVAEALAGIESPAVRFGGHAMAAGLTLPPEALATFSRGFAAAVARRADQRDDAGLIWTDGELGPGEFTAEVATALQAAGPWGAGFPEPVFDNEFDVVEQRVVGGAHLQLSLRHPAGGAPLRAIAFGRTVLAVPGTRVRVAYRLDLDRYRDGRTAQLVVTAIVA